MKRKEVGPLSYADLTEPGKVSIIDLSDVEATAVKNLVIADILRGAQLAQEERHNRAAAQNGAMPRTLVIIEEAHEFLSRERVAKMPALFQQVSRIAKRGRKRWLGLMFVTQHPQHLPDELLGLLNNYLIHKISDASVIGHLRRSIGGIDDSLWQRAPSLAPGQAIASFGHLTRPLLVAVAPTPCQLRMAEQ